MKNPLLRWAFPALDVQLKVCYAILDTIDYASNSGEKKVASELAKVASKYLGEYSELLSNDKMKKDADTEGA